MSHPPSSVELSRYLQQNLSLGLPPPLLSPDRQGLPGTLADMPVVLEGLSPFACSYHLATLHSWEAPPCIFFSPDLKSIVPAHILILAMYFLLLSSFLYVRSRFFIIFNVVAAPNFSISSSDTLSMSSVFN